MSDKLASQVSRRSKASYDLITISVLGIVVFIVSGVFELFEALSEFILQFKEYWVDEILVVFILLAFAFGIYSLRRWHELKEEINERQRVEGLAKGQNQILEMITAGQFLPTTLESITLLIEQQSPHTACTILLLDTNESRLRIGAAPHLPTSYTNALDGLVIGPETGSCGTAAFLSKPVFVTDIEHDPLWAKFRGLALEHGLRACWCMPIFSNKGQVLGTFAIYYPAPKSPTLHDFNLIKTATHIAGVAIEHNQAFELIRVSNGRLQTLSQKLVEAQEAERRNIARELHDEIGQALTALKINLQVLVRLKEVTYSPQLQESINMVEAILQQVRNLSLELRPSLLDDLGLLAALRWYTDRLAQRSNLSIHISNNLPEIKLDPGIETNCFRIVQEALTNIIKQANAQNVIIDLRLCNQYIQLTIENDSVGFKAQADNGLNLGLLRLQERALLSGGNLVIESLPKAGTRVVVLLGLVKERN